MPWSNPATRSSGYSVTATNWNELANDLTFLARVAYQAFTADVPITATTVGTANQIVSAGAATYEAVPHRIEFFCPRYQGATGALSGLILRDGTTVLGTFTTAAASANIDALYVSTVLTPTAASHTYNVAAWVASGTGTMKAGTGGTAGDATTFLNGYIQVTRIPT